MGKKMKSFDAEAAATEALKTIGLFGDNPDILKILIRSALNDAYSDGKLDGIEESFEVIRKQEGSL